ncbi:hypothetical protein ANN_06623 [Periplaneta americana]|uniref:Uncharacterized protein n=1 Tax=Periplaneta americana TaxID=6978 RepID=A0ABQ8TFN4_PERAM|nr:hypothetical protein ANN_06623 [Periplaneta americana]
MNPGSSTENYPAFARTGLRVNPRKNLKQVTCLDRDSNPGHLVSRPDALTVTPQVWTRPGISPDREVLARKLYHIGKLNLVTEDQAPLIINTQPGKHNKPCCGASGAYCRQASSGEKRKVLYYSVPQPVCQFLGPGVDVTFIPFIVEHLKVLHDKFGEYSPTYGHEWGWIRDPFNEEEKELVWSLVEKKLHTEGCPGRNGEREKSSGQKKISDERRH